MQTTITKISAAPAYTTLACTDIDRAVTFYRDTLGFGVESLTNRGGGWMVHCGQGTGLSLYERSAPPECDTTAATFVVEDLEGAMDDLRGHGVRFEEYDLPYLKTVRGVAIQGPSKACWFKDPDGNILSLVQM